MGGQQHQAEIEKEATAASEVENKTVETVEVTETTETENNTTEPEVDGTVSNEPETENSQEGVSDLTDEVKVEATENTQG